MLLLEIVMDLCRTVYKCTFLRILSKRICKILTVLILTVLTVLFIINYNSYRYNSSERIFHLFQKIINR